ncbi:polyphosphate kinase 1 [Vibrio tapetis]|uniref:Polyphosphate kinase n=1 Tax=Vibrio tapetis subsp. tapetis TaxID=1671868 RepID=A0A2N8ZF02_9VIBR|nr:polyphosphate kinase 1 [Vibrio tapetis]SON50491.1 polyphosphate kinase, component of RNA degradosome [Vibrio tapetis subsp. tapetis]
MNADKLSSEKLFTEKELSWLSFNERVLQEAADKNVPLIERIRFLGIFSNNLDEFYKVRFSDIKRRIVINQEQGTVDDSEQLLAKMQEKALTLNHAFDELYSDLLLEMARRGIFLVNETQLNDKQKKWVRKFFHHEVLPHIAPQLMNDDIDVLQFLKDECAYLSVELSSDALEKEQHTQYALVEIPTEHLPRFIIMPEQKGEKRKTIILLDNIIRYCLDDLFRGFFEYQSLHCYAMKVTRDAEYDLNTEDEHGILEQMSEGLNQRLTAMPVRFVYEREMPQAMLSFLSKKLQLSNYDSLIPGGRYHNFKDFIHFPNVGRGYLENKPLTPIRNADFDHFINSFDAISYQDILLHYPYHAFDHTTEFVRQASFDPKVVAIKINVYRVAKNSKLLNSLIDAVNNGKQVTVVIELQARFDEEANIEWSRVLTDAGVKVIFGATGLKIHAKLLLVTRREADKIVRYAHIGTGNFHEKTARIYTDLSLFTSNADLTKEVQDVFGYIEHPYRPVKFHHLIVSPRNTRQQLYRLVDNEIANIKLGKKAGISLKLNNLVDKKIINKLYEASSAGVNVRIIVRGMCALIPEIKGVSENIQVISIVDRFLEHSRVLITENGGKPLVYISSADWMSRNLDHRIEVGTPILDPNIKQQIIDIVDIHFTDTVKAKKIDAMLSNDYVSRGNRKKIRSQLQIYNYIKQKEKLTKKSYTQEES